MPQPVTYLFKNPIKHQNELIYDIQVRPAVMRDLSALEGIAGTFTRAGQDDRAPDRFDRERGGRDLARGRSRARGDRPPFFYRLAACSDLAGALALHCHWPPSEIDALTAEELKYWNGVVSAAARRMRREMRREMNRGTNSANQD
jgi:hypothetical protein